MASEHFAGFDIHDATYKRVNDQPIDLSILVPKQIQPGPRPVLVKFHGGGLVTGSRLYKDWFHTWILQYATRHSAIIVTPDYRLLPESKGLDILEDIQDFWRWTEHQLPRFLGSFNLEADLKHILATGDSAGGWLAAQSAFERPDLVKATIGQYPMLDLRAPHYTQAYEKHPCGAPMLDNLIVDNAIRAVKPGRICTSAEPPERSDIVFSAFQHGRFGELLGQDRRLYPMERLEDMKGFKMPPMLIIHGSEDSAVPVEGSENFVKQCKELQPDTEVKLVVQKGDHGFDGVNTLEDEWLSNALGLVTKAWL
ncbi:alpha/beta-hydrolase [Saccharata proteae CBS 121410]|uniref:Alpha/beta-hydrolase n=1 Tax=Saccharata proteae CBS 121410 TaxID=1314787 RepID=A0A9P4LYQ2_9PEZI|nr:alpha/beta-hydrolase [Saccharata proteae CBS 121410]